MRMLGYCGNPPCGVGPVPLFVGQCRACYQWAYRHHGSQRPAETVMRSAPKVIERLVATRSIGITR